MPNYLKIKKYTLFLFPLILFVFNFISKFFFLTNEEIGLDEPFTIYHAQFDFGTIIEQLKNYNNPPLYELILHPWIRVFGISPLSVRIPPLIFACLSPVVLYYFGKRFFSIQVAVASSLLLSTSSLLFYYSHDCRVYSLFLLLSLLSMYFFLEILMEEGQTIKSVFLFTFFSCLLIYAHYFGIFILFFQVLHLIIFFKDKWLRFFLYYLLIFLLYLPHLYPMLTRMGDSVKNGTWLNPPNGIESLYNMLWAFSNFPFLTVSCIVIFVFSLGKLILQKNLLPFNKNNLFLLIWFLFPFFGMFFISYWVPMYISRYLIFALPAYYLLLVVCVHYLIKQVIFRNLALLFLIVSFGFTINFKDDKKGKVKEAVGFIKSVKDSTTLVIVRPHEVLLPFAYYYNKNYFSAVDDAREHYSMDSLMRRDNIFVLNLGYEFDLVNINHKFKTVIYFGDGQKYNDPETEIIKTINTSYKLVEQKNIDKSLAVRVYTD